MGSGISLSDGSILIYCHQRISVSVQGQKNDYDVTILSLFILVSTCKME
jgi:hypothetical protein